MAFDRDYLAQVGGTGRAGHAWRYVTTDTIATADGAGYFNAAHRELQVGDTIDVIVVDDVDTPASLTDAGKLVVNSNASGVVDCTNETAFTTTDSD